MFTQLSMPKKSLIPYGDLIICLLIVFFIYGTVSLARRWVIEFQPSVVIDLSVKSLPSYSMYSLFRALIAYGLSLTFTLIVGYWAAKSRPAEKIILPLLDIAQSIPVLGFLPGLVLGLIALFPHTNFGLELSCIIMIFTGQVWNMTFSYYSSLKVLPHHYYELSKNIQLSPLQKLINIELPYSASGLAWNSLMSMAGGWFFLTVCEAFTLGERHFRLLGIGSYMAVAIEKGDTYAMVAGFIAMVVVIVFMDFVIWRPVVAWTRKFRVDEQDEQINDIPFIQILLKDSAIVRIGERILRVMRESLAHHIKITAFWTLNAPHILKQFFIHVRRLGRNISHVRRLWIFVLGAFAIGMCIFIGNLISHLEPQEYVRIIMSAAFSFFRVCLAIVISTLWTLPFGIWIGLSPKRTKFFQPLIQIAASFPAPMLYPLALLLLHALGIQLGIGAAILMLLGVQWYVLFNVLAGATLISRELRDIFQLAALPRFYVWKNLYIPSVFPNLVTGWVTAAGGAWNASIVAEYIQYKDQTLKTIGLGALISETTASGNFELLAASLLAMVVIVVSFNRFVWKRLYYFAERRYRFER